MSHGVEKHIGLFYKKSNKYPLKCFNLNTYFKFNSIIYATKLKKLYNFKENLLNTYIRFIHLISFYVQLPINSMITVYTYELSLKYVIAFVSTYS